MTQILAELAVNDEGAVNEAIFKKLPYRFDPARPASERIDDGVEGADLVDFIDGLRGSAGAPSDDELKVLLENGLVSRPSFPQHKTPYDWEHNQIIKNDIVS